MCGTRSLTQRANYAITPNERPRPVRGVLAELGLLIYSKTQPPPTHTHIWASLGLRGNPDKGVRQLYMPEAPRGGTDLIQDQMSGSTRGNRKCRQASDTCCWALSCSRTTSELQPKA